MSDTGAALRQASDQLLGDLESLSDLEEVKRHIEPGDPRLIELAATIEVLAQRVLASSARQRQLTIEANDPSHPVAETPRAISAILADWRNAERRALAAPEGSAEEAEADEALDRFKEEYREAHDWATHPHDA
jgi:hypothetical protein